MRSCYDDQMSRYILALDQGTTSTRAIVFDQGFAPVAVAQKDLTQYYPQPGWVEHDADEIWAAAVEVCREAIASVGGPGTIACIGLTNQRETTVVWDADGRPAHRAIVWQDRRTSAVCEDLRARGLERAVQSDTGLLLDPYFSATKIRWILDQERFAVAGEDALHLRFGTIDSWLIWKLTGGRVHATDVTNASRTLLMGLAHRAWDDDLRAIFGVPAAMLPNILPSAGLFGATDEVVFGRAIPITGVAGDQQAALVGHGCLAPGEAKATYGTGCFLVANAGDQKPTSAHRLLATMGYQTSSEIAYALEGSIFAAGATIQWLKEGLGAIAASRDSEAIAASLADNGGVYCVPAFAGLGAPQWEADARGAVFGLTRDSTKAHLVRAGLEAIAYQTEDLLTALAADGVQLTQLNVDGGVTANSWMMQFLADICAIPVQRPPFQEVTALGAARLAAVGAGIAPSLSALPAPPAAAIRWTPQIAPDARARLLAGWRAAVEGTLGHALASKRARP
jgi:glycerol kinase